MTRAYLQQYGILELLKGASFDLINMREKKNNKIKERSPSLKAFLEIEWSFGADGLSRVHSKTSTYVHIGVKPSAWVTTISTCIAIARLLTAIAKVLVSAISSALIETRIIVATHATTSESSGTCTVTIASASVATEPSVRVASTISA